MAFHQAVDLLESPHISDAHTSTKFEAGLTLFLFFSFCSFFSILFFILTSLTNFTIAFEHSITLIKLIKQKQMELSRIRISCLSSMCLTGSDKSNAILKVIIYHCSLILLIFLYFRNYSMKTLQRIFIS
jgi:hypothetical protein